MCLHQVNVLINEGCNKKKQIQKKKVVNLLQAVFMSSINTRSHATVFSICIRTVWICEDQLILRILSNRI